jgi:hypothetical protein
MNFADQEELAERVERRRKRQRRDATWRVFTWLVWILTAAAVLVTGAIFVDPALPLNPFPPATLPVLATGPVVTPVLSVIPATETAIVLPTATMLPTDTVTPEPTITSTATITAQPPTSDLSAVYPFILKSDPVPMSNLVFHPDGNCNWQGIAGEVQDMQGRAMNGLSVHLTGTYNGKPVDMTTLTGTAQAWYGESGFEFVLGTTPLDSQGGLFLQLADQSQLALSGAVSVNTYADCAKNLVLVNFKQVR